MGMAAILAMWPGSFIQTFVPPPQGGSTYNLALIGEAVSEEKMFKHCRRRRQRQRPQQRQRRQRMPEQGYTISSPCEPNGSGELIINFWYTFGWKWWVVSFSDYLGLLNACSYDVIGWVDRFGFQNFCNPVKDALLSNKYLHTLFLWEKVAKCYQSWF